jgi:transposase-like protein
MKDLLKGLMESTMEEELLMYTQAEWHERTQARIDYRNWHRHRDFLTECGGIEDIALPRLRKTNFRTKVFKNYQRRQNAVDRALKNIFVARVSTRRVREVLSALLEHPIRHKEHIQRDQDPETLFSF